MTPGGGFVTAQGASSLPPGFDVTIASLDLQVAWLRLF
jgi:hypothetical protein